MQLVRRDRQGDPLACLMWMQLGELRWWTSHRQAMNSGQLLSRDAPLSQ